MGGYLGGFIQWTLQYLIGITRYSTSRWQLLSENINLWKIQSQQPSSKPVAQNEVPVDFIAVYLSLLWEFDV